MRKLSAARLDVDHVRTMLEERLAREGLAPVDDGRGESWEHGAAMQTGSKVMRFTADAEAARRLYLSWARSVLGERQCFRQHADALVPARGAWRMHAAGRTNAEVARRFKVSRGVIEKVLRTVARRAPPPPVANPWRRSGREAAWSAIEQRKGDRMAKDEQKSQWQRYSLIKLRAGETVDVPGKGDKVSLVDVDALPTVGGLDVKYEGRGYELVDKDGAVNMSKRTEHDGTLDLVITVPWYKIKQAERVTEAA